MSVERSQSRTGNSIVGRIPQVSEMEVKTQEQVLKLYSACVVIISIQRNEQNTRFKHQICSNMLLSMLSSLQDPIGSGSCGMGLWGFFRLQFGLLM